MEDISKEKCIKSTPKCIPSSVGLRPFVKPEFLHARPGDLIEIDHTIYSDWAIYFGKGEVVLLAGDLLAGRTTHALVVKRKLTDLSEQNVLMRVNNKKVPAKNRGLVPFKAKTIIQNVNKLIGKTVEYNILTRNSEHHVTEWRFGQGWSDQTKTALQAMTIFSTPSPPRDIAGKSPQETFSDSIKSILKTQSSIEELSSPVQDISGIEIIE